MTVRRGIHKRLFIRFRFNFMPDSAKCAHLHISEARVFGGTAAEGPKHLSPALGVIDLQVRG